MLGAVGAAPGGREALAKQGATDAVFATLENAQRDGDAPLAEACEAAVSHLVSADDVRKALEKLRPYAADGALAALATSPAALGALAHDADNLAAMLLCRRVVVARGFATPVQRAASCRGLLHVGPARAASFLLLRCRRSAQCLAFSFLLNICPGGVVVTLGGRCVRMRARVRSCHRSGQLDFAEVIADGGGVQLLVDVLSAATALPDTPETVALVHALLKVRRWQCTLIAYQDWRSELRR